MDALSELSKLEVVIATGMETFIDVGNALRQIRDERLYRDGYKSFEEYAKERWGWGKAHAYRMIQAAQVDANLSPIGDGRPKSESQYREVAKAPAEKQAEVVQKANDKAASEDREPTAEDFKQAVSEVIYEDVVEDAGDPEPPAKPMKKKQAKPYDSATVDAFDRCDSRLGTLRELVSRLMRVERELLLEWLKEPI